MIFCLVNDMMPVFIDVGGLQNAIKWGCLKAYYTLKLEKVVKKKHSCIFFIST